MRGSFRGVSDRTLAAAIEDHWGAAIQGLRYLAVGAGAYHWVVDRVAGGRCFVTCDDLDIKPWLGPDRDTVYEGLLRAYRCAVELRAEGLDVVAAPLPSDSGEPAHRLDERYSLSVFEHVDGEPGRWGRSLAPPGVPAVVTALAALHTSAARVDLDERRLELPARAAFEAALDQLDRPWSDGPLADEARLALTPHLDRILRGLARLDDVAGRIDAEGAPVVITHGEPHPGNLLRRGDRLTLVDWDTVARARPERDLWMPTQVDATVPRHYRELTGFELDPAVLDAYRLLWALSDLASYTSKLRRPHVDDADARGALAAIRDVLGGGEPRPYGPRTED